MQATLDEKIQDPTESRIKELDSRLEKLLDSIQNEVSEDKIPTLMNGLDSFGKKFKDFLLNEILPKFDWDPALIKFKTLLAHDLQKAPNAVIGYCTPIRLNADNYLLVKDRIVDALTRMKTALNIIQSINSSTQTHTTLLLDVKELNNLLTIEYENLLPKEVKYNQGKQYINFQIENHLSTTNNLLTLEQFFSIDTLLLNLTREQSCKDAKVLITEDDNFRYIRVFDNATETWPENVQKLFKEKYYEGLNNPDAILTSDRSGLGMVFFLAGQRQAKSKKFLPTPFAQCINADGTNSQLKHIIVAFPKDLN